MIGFMDVVKNWGDFDPRRNYEPVDGFNIGYMGRESSRPRDLNLVNREFDGSSNTYSDSEAGYRVLRPVGKEAALHQKRAYERRMIEAMRLVTSAFNGNEYARLNLKNAVLSPVFAREALGISDFPKLFGDVIDRAVLSNYLETPYTWNQVAKLSTVSDFREVKRFRIDHGTGIGLLDGSGNLQPVEMGGPYPEDKLTDGLFQYRVQKYGRRMPFFWETFINDDLNAIKDTPARFGRAMRRMEEYFVTKLYAGNLTFFSNVNKNIVNAANSGSPYTANNPPLSITALAQALVVMSLQRDLDNGPIDIEAVTLVIPPSLKVTAQNILNADYFWANDQGGTLSGTSSAQRLNVRNWAKNIVSLAVNYYLPIVDTLNGQTSWYLFSDPNSGRPALEFGKLRGHENPDLFMKLPNSVAIGEGTMGPGMGAIPGTTNMNPTEGDFDTDSIHYKIRHVFGGTQIDPLMAVFSNGTNS